MAHIDDAFRVDTLSLSDSVLITQGVLDPSIGAGFEAPEGSMYLRSFGTDSSVYSKVGAIDTDWRMISSTDMSQIFSATREPTGFVDRSDSHISFDVPTRTFSIQPLAPATSFDYLIHGIRYTINNTVTLTTPNTTGTYFIYLDTASTLHYQTTFDASILMDKAIVAIVYWNATAGNAPYFADERHGITMDGMTHLYLHISLGTQYINGFSLLNIISNEQPPTNAAARFGVSDGVILDEDLRHDIYNTGGKVNVYDLEQSLVSIAQIPVLYRLGTTAEWNIKPATNYPMIESGTVGYVGASSLPAWNELFGTEWRLTQVTSNRLFLMHYFATNDVNHPIVGVLGTSQYQNTPQGQREAEVELKTLTGLPFQEFTPIASVIFEVSTSFDNAVHARIHQTSDGLDYVDWRTVNSFGSGGSSTQNVFDRITDGTNIAVADGSTDTLTFAAGTGISVVVDPLTDSVTITNTQSGASDVVLSRHNETITQTFGVDPISVLFNTEVKNDTAYSYSEGSVTVNQNGSYLISVNVSYVASSSTATTVKTEIVRNNAPVSGSIAYSNHVSGFDGRSTVPLHAVVNLVAGDVINIRSSRESGVGFITTQEHGCRLNMYKLR